MRKGSKYAPEQKERHREAMRKWREANPITDETRKKLRDARLGKHIYYPPSPEALENKRAKMKGKPSAFKGHKHTSETRLKMSINGKGKKSGRKGVPKSKEQVEKMRMACKGKPSTFLGHKHTEDAKKKMSESKLGIPSGRQPMLGKRHSEETRAKMRQAHVGRIYPKGRRPSEETRKKHRKRMLGNKHLLGHKHSPETLEKMRIASTGRLHTEEEKEKISLANSGPASYRWRGGIGKGRYGRGWKKARREILARDHELCVICFEPSNTGKKIEVHHIIPVIDCNDKNLEPNLLANLCCLCSKHHHLAENHLDESIPQLQTLLSGRYGYQYYKGLPSQILSLSTNEGE